MRVLLVEDNLLFARSIEALIRYSAPFHVAFTHVDTLDAAIEQLRKACFEIVLLDLTLPDSSGLSTLIELRKKAFGLPIVVLTGRDDEGIGVEAVKAGAQDYLIKGSLDGLTIIRAMQYAVERAKYLADREEFVASLTHDLRNPLIGCDKLISLILDGSVDVSRQTNLLQHVKLSNRAVISMIDNLLELYRFDKTLVELRLESVNLVRLATSCMDEWEPIAIMQGIELFRDLEQDTVNVLADSSSIRRVLQNLLDNAIKYSSTGSSITVKISTDTDNAIVQVVNSGQLLGDEDLERVFSRFWRADSGKITAVGTGLGLHLCRRLVELHKGTISCANSEDGKNTVFCVSLPKLPRARSEG